MYHLELIGFYDDGIVCKNPNCTDEDYKPGGQMYGYQKESKINWFSLANYWRFDGIRKTIKMTDDEWERVQSEIKSRV